MPKTDKKTRKKDGFFRQSHSAPLKKLCIHHATLIVCLAISFVLIHRVSKGREWDGGTSHWIYCGDPSMQSSDGMLDIYT